MQTYESCIYAGKVAHKRYAPVPHGFNYPLFMMYLDLKELPFLFKSFWCWTYQGWNIASFFRKDYADGQAADLDLTAAAQSDDLTESVDYGAIAKSVLAETLLKHA